MQCRAIELDTTGTTQARQQPRYIKREKTKDKEKKEKIKGKMDKRKKRH